MPTTLENLQTDIFTDFDETITGDGSIDPLGLQIIWTSLGNRIFHNRLNSISTNIRSYTLNLFHHAVIRGACRRYAEQFVNKVGKPPYNNSSDLHEGLAIFLECLMAHVILQHSLSVSEDLMIPGVSKLSGMLASQSNQEICKSIPVDRADGILVRQHQLGVHGRHKGPFQQMNLFHKQDYYGDEKLWNEIDKLFNSGPLSHLKEMLIELIGTTVLKAKPYNQKPIRIKVSTLITPALVDAYNQAMQESVITASRFSVFWKDHLGLSDAKSPAGKLYQYVSANQLSDEETIFKSVSSHDDEPIFKAINAIEPFISMIQKIMERLLSRGQDMDITALAKPIKYQFANPAIEVESLSGYLIETFLSEAASRRLRKLMSIYSSCLKPFNPESFVHQLIDFHQDIMRQRGNAPWITSGIHGTITQHRTFAYSEKATELQNNYGWVNSYYISTVVALHKGMPV